MRRRPHIEFIDQNNFTIWLYHRKEAFERGSIIEGTVGSSEGVSLYVVQTSSAHPLLCEKPRSNAWEATLIFPISCKWMRTTLIIYTLKWIMVEFPWVKHPSNIGSVSSVANCEKFAMQLCLWLGGEWLPLLQFPTNISGTHTYIPFFCKWDVNVVKYFMYECYDEIYCIGKN